MSEATPTNASMQVNYGEQISELARKLEASASGPVDQIPGAVPVQIKVADVKLGDAAPPLVDKRTRRPAIKHEFKPTGMPESKLAPDPVVERILATGLHTDGLLSSEPMVDMSTFGQAEVQDEAADEAEAPTDAADDFSREALAAVEAAASRNLSDAELMALCRPFVDSSMKRPTFISRPILGKVYIGTYPAYGEILTAETMLGNPGDNAPVNRRMEYNLLAELASVVKGFVFAHDPMLAVISMYPHDYAKWPKLHPASFLNALHPSMREIVFPQLSAQYVAWKVAVTPSNAEMEKYYGLIG